MKKVAMAAAAALVALGAVSGFARAEEAAASDGVRVLVATFERQPLDRVVVLRGVAEAARRVEVKAQTSGLVVSEPLRRGAIVAQGDVLCRLEPGERPALLAEAEALLEQANADAAASARLERDGFSSATAVAADRAALAAAEASVAAIELDIERLVVAAPFDGVLETDAAELGALLQPGAVCAELIDIDPIRFVGYATELEVGALRVGGPATARLLDGREVDAEVTFIARAADPATRTFRVEATADNPEERAGGQLRSGFSAELTLPIEAALGHFIPSSTLTLDSDGRLGVRVVAEGETGPVARFKPVSILRDARDGVWVSGLAEAEVVIIRGQEYVSDGAPIEPVTEAEAAAALAGDG